MSAQSSSNFLLASSEPAVLSTLEPILRARGAHVDIALSGEAALAQLRRRRKHKLVLIDSRLQGADLSDLLVEARNGAGARAFPIVLIAETVTPDLLNRLHEGFVDDVVSAATEPEFWQVRLDTALHAYRVTRDLDLLRESSALDALYDRLTGVYNRDSILSMLFRETDRAQRMKNSLCMVLFDVDDFGHWNAQLGAAACDEILFQIASRVTHLLRSYDLLGRVGKDEFLVGMPGCSTINALLLAERLQTEVFGEPFQVEGRSARLTATFGISNSYGRSPLVVLHEAEQALERAQSAGKGAIECFVESPRPVPLLTPAGRVAS